MDGWINWWRSSSAREGGANLAVPIGATNSCKCRRKHRFVFYPFLWTCLETQWIDRLNDWWMDGWMDGSMDGWMDWSNDIWIDGSMDCPPPPLPHLLWPPRPPLNLPTAIPSSLKRILSTRHVSVSDPYRLSHWYPRLPRNGGVRPRRRAAPT